MNLRHVFACFMLLAAFAALPPPAATATQFNSAATSL